jgi:hypothetical protein
MTIVDYALTVPSSNARSLNAVVTATPRKPWVTGSGVSSAAQGRLIDAYVQTSTALAEYFDDEVYRLPAGAYGSVPGAITGQWTSSTALVNGETQVYGGQLIYPTVNFTSGYLPTQGVGTDYSAFTGNQVYYRAIYQAATPHQSGILSILGSGFTASDLQQVGSGKLNIEIKLPSATGWLDLGKAYNSGTFTGVDGDGCRTAQSASTWSWTAGTFSTASSGYMTIIRVTILNSAVVLDSISETAW